MKHKKKIIVIAVIIGILGASYFFTDNKSDNIRYITERVSKGDIVNTVLATGSVSAYQKVSVGAQVSGQIDKLYVKLGQTVKKGDMIAEIDSTTQTNDLKTAKSNLEIYKAQLKSKTIAMTIAQTQYNRQRNLLNADAGSKEEFENAKNALALAKSEVDVLKSQIEQANISVSTAETNVGYTKITSPLDGIIVSVPVEQGQTVNSNQTTPTIVEIADLSKMIIKPEISEGDITKVKAGMPVDFSIIGNPDKTYHTTLQSVDPGTTTLTDGTSSTSSSTSSASSSTAIYYYGNLIVPNEDKQLRISMTTQNTIIVGKAENVLIIPTITIKKEKGKDFVYVLGKDKQPQKREIKVGISDELNSQIISGLSEGEEVVSSQTDGSINTPIRRGTRS